MNLNVNEVNSGIIKFLKELTFNPATVKHPHYRLIGRLWYTQAPVNWSITKLPKLVTSQITNCLPQATGSMFLLTGSNEVTPIEIWKKFL